MAFILMMLAKNILNEDVFNQVLISETFIQNSMFCLFICLMIFAELKHHVSFYLLYNLFAKNKFCLSPDTVFFQHHEFFLLFNFLS